MGALCFRVKGSSIKLERTLYNPWLHFLTAYNHSHTCGKGFYLCGYQSNELRKCGVESFKQFDEDNYETLRGVVGVLL